MYQVGPLGPTSAQTFKVFPAWEGFSCFSAHKSQEDKEVGHRVLFLLLWLCISRAHDEVITFPVLLLFCIVWKLCFYCVTLREEKRVNKPDVTPVSRQEPRLDPAT